MQPSSHGEFDKVGLRCGAWCVCRWACALACWHLSTGVCYNVHVFSYVWVMNNCGNKCVIHIRVHQVICMHLRLYVNVLILLEIMVETTYVYRDYFCDIMQSHQCVISKGMLLLLCLRAKHISFHSRMWSSRQLLQMLTALHSLSSSTAQTTFTQPLNNHPQQPLFWATAPLSCSGTCPQEDLCMCYAWTISHAQRMPTIIALQVCMYV